jgi:hypothetical protein
MAKETRGRDQGSSPSRESMPALDKVEHSPLSV